MLSYDLSPFVPEGIGIFDLIQKSKESRLDEYLLGVWWFFNANICQAEENHSLSFGLMVYSGEQNCILKLLL